MTLLERLNGSGRAGGAHSGNRGAAKTVIVLGGDGYCGWPTSLHLSEVGYRVVIVDSLVRREWDEDLGSHSLTPIRSIEERIAAWEELRGDSIAVELGDLVDGEFLADVIARYAPDAVVHFAEQSSAPVPGAPEGGRTTSASSGSGTTRSTPSRSSRAACPSTAASSSARLGGFAAGFNGEDGDLTVRIGRLGYRVVTDPRIQFFTETPARSPT